MIENFEVILGPGGVSVGGWSIHRRGDYEHCLDPREIATLPEPLAVEFRHNGILIEQGVLDSRGNWWRTMDEELVFYSGKLRPMSVARNLHAQTPIRFDPDKEEGVVFYDGRLIPLSQAQAIAREEVERHQDSQTSKDPGANSPKNNPASEWDRQGLNLGARFESFWNELTVRKQLLKLLQTIQTAKQDAEITEQRAMAEAETARQEMEIARLAYWGITGPLDLAHLPEGVFTFDQLFATPPDWFARRYKKRFIKWIQNNRYLEDLAGQQVITRVGYEKLIAKAQENRRARKTQWKANKVKEQTSLANPLPEPIKRRSARTLVASKKRVKKTSGPPL